MKMRAAVIRETMKPRPYKHSKPFAIEEVELDPPGEGEVLVRIRAAGLCHSDLSTVNGDRPRPMPMVLGHEAAGEVVELGPGVKDLAAGDHVIVVFVPSWGWHQFRAGPEEPFGFLCAVVVDRDRPVLPTEEDLAALRRDPEIAAFIRV